MATVSVPSARLPGEGGRNGMRDTGDPDEFNLDVIADQLRVS
jgi:hypothetical protein